MTQFPFTLCGSRNWPRPDADCELCRGEEPESERDEYQEWVDERIMEDP